MHDIWCEDAESGRHVHVTADSLHAAQVAWDALRDAGYTMISRRPG